MSLEINGSGLSSRITAILALACCGLAAACGGDKESTTSGSGGAGGSAMSGSGGGGDACSPGPQDIPSKQKVSVEIENTTAVDKFVLTGCSGCETIQVEEKGDLDYVALPTTLTPAQTCGCECSPPIVYPVSYHRIPAGMSYTATWDARVLDICTSDQDCGGGVTAPKVVAALSPAEPGDYRLSFGLTDKVPAACMQVGATDDYMCSAPAQPDPNPGGAFYPIELTLPASGDVSLKLPLQ